MHALFDLGGTKTRVAVANSEDSLKNNQIFLTNHNFNEGMENIVNAIKKLAGGKKIKSIIGGVGNPLDENKSKMINSFKDSFLDWVDKPIKKILADEFHVPVYLENDSAMVGLGEAVYGGGKGYEIVAYITISTGVGGARITRKKIDLSCQGFEPGHQIIQNPKTGKFRLEDFIAGKTIQKETGKIPSSIKSDFFWREKALKLAYGLNNVIVFWSPSVVVLGGSIANDIPMDIVKKELEKYLKIFKKTTPIKKGLLGDLGGLYGALYYAQKINITN